MSDPEAKAIAASIISGLEPREILAAFCLATAALEFATLPETWPVFYEYLKMNDLFLSGGLSQTEREACKGAAAFCAAKGLIS